jgi:hypothetical protein
MIALTNPKITAIRARISQAELPSMRMPGRIQAATPTAIAPIIQRTMSFISNLLPEEIGG